MGDHPDTLVKQRHDYDRDYNDDDDLDLDDLELGGADTMMMLDVEGGDHHHIGGGARLKSAVTGRTTAAGVGAELPYDPIDAAIWGCCVSDRRVSGLLYALLAGTLFGINFNPIFYVIQNVPDAPQNVLYYVFWHYLGIWITSMISWLAYCAAVKNRPQFVLPEMALPATMS